MVPAIRGTRSDLVTDLKADGQGLAHRDRLGLRNGLVVVQVAVCTLLLLCTGLFLRSLQSAQTTNIGLRTRNLLLLSFDPGLDRRADSESRQLFRDLLERTRALPGVESATLTSAVPLTFIISNSKFVPEASANRAGTERIGADIYAVGPQFFETMGISLLAGDDFRSARAGTTRPAIVNEAFARAMFPGQSPIGRRVIGDGKALDVVGVVATAKSRSIGEAPRPSIYVPILNEVLGEGNAPGRHPDRQNQRPRDDRCCSSAGDHSRPRSSARGVRCPDDGESRARCADRAESPMVAVRRSGNHRAGGGDCRHLRRDQLRRDQPASRSSASGWRSERGRARFSPWS